jgi:hypothetical protein
MIASQDRKIAMARVSPAAQAATTHGGALYCNLRELSGSFRVVSSLLELEKQGDQASPQVGCVAGCAPRGERGCELAGDRVGACSKLAALRPILGNEGQRVVRRYRRFSSRTNGRHRRCVGP